MTTKISQNNFREVTESEELLITKIVKSGGYFSDKHNNLYLLNVLGDYAEILFIKSKVINIGTNREQGYYEPSYQVYEPITELYNRIPMRR